ncbi:MAG TPA: DoxX family protein [Rhizomicrobium sp.]
MHTLFSPTLFTSGLSVLFAGTAAVHLLGWRALREAYTRWGYPRGFREVTGSLLLVAAVCLYFPPVHVAGLAIAALVMFLSATTLLHHRQYGFAAPVIALLFALIPVTLGAPV